VVQYRSIVGLPIVLHACQMSAASCDRASNSSWNDVAWINSGKRNRKHARSRTCLPQPSGTVSSNILRYSINESFHEGFLRLRHSIIAVMPRRSFPAVAAPYPVRHSYPLRHCRSLRNQSATPLWLVNHGEDLYTMKESLP
jgi:hypothetical protein